MQTGGSLANSFMNSILGSTGQESQTLGQQNQYALGLGGLANATDAQKMQIFNSIFNNTNQASQTGLNASGQSSQGTQNATQGLGQNWNNIANAFGQANNNLTGLAGQALNYAGQNVGLMASPFSGLGQQFTGTGFTQGLIGAGNAMSGRRT
jgi:hypothetical protein